MAIGYIRMYITDKGDLKVIISTTRAFYIHIFEYIYVGKLAHNKTIIPQGGNS